MDHTSEDWTEEHQQNSEPDFYGKWRNIYSAPKDGSTFIAYEEGYGIHECWWDDGHDGGAGGFRSPHHGWSPTHWMFLPDAPGTTWRNDE